MGDRDPVLDGLPTRRSCPMGPPDELAELRSTRPIARFTFPDGHCGWIVTGYAQARAILADPRFSVRVELSHPTVTGERAEHFSPADYPPGVFSKLDPPEHTRFRRQFAGQFTARRMRELSTRVTEIADRRAAAMVRLGPPADLVRDFARPVAALVICELFGVPEADRASFQRDAATLFDLQHSYADARAGITRCLLYLANLVRGRRTAPGADVLSGVVEAGELTQPEIVGAALGMLIAALESAVHMIALGTYALLTRPDQLAALRADPGLLDGAVEELLRFLTVVKDGTQRTPMEDVEIDGVLLPAGQTVLVHLPAANRDPARFPDPDRLDVARPYPPGHLAFGHGIHLCLGQQLARVEIRAAHAALLRHAPGLRLAVPVEEVAVGVDMAMNGVRVLPVAW